MLACLVLVESGQIFFCLTFHQEFRFEIVYPPHDDLRSH